MSINPRQISIFVMNENDLPNLSRFDCQDDEMNRFLNEECYNEQQLGLNKTYVLYFNGQFAAFCSICADRISLADTEKGDFALPRNSVPAIKIARLGRAKAFRELQLGRYLLEYIQLRVLDLAEAVGVRFLTLDAYPNRVSFYESMGFIQNIQQDKRKATVSMRLDIYTDMEAVSEATRDTSA